MTEVNPADTTRAMAFDLWMKAPMPMVTLFKTLDVTRLVRISRRRHVKFNMLMCWCIGRAASQVKEFMMLPGRRETDPLRQPRSQHHCCRFQRRSELVRHTVHRRHSLIQRRLPEAHPTSGRIMHEPRPDRQHGHRHLGATQFDIDGAVGMYSGIFNNPS